jgi:hypothetical protein
MVESERFEETARKTKVTLLEALRPFSYAVSIRKGDHAWVVFRDRSYVFIESLSSSYSEDSVVTFEGPHRR